MSQTRARLYIDNLEQLASDMLEYVMNPMNTREIIGIINQVYEEYKLPRESWIWGWIYAYTRNRTQDINGLIVTLCQTGNSNELLNSITQFLAFGGWTETSANTALVRGIISRLSGYQGIGEDHSLTADNTQRLNELFNAQAQKVKAQAEVSHHARIERRDELKTLPRRSIKTDGTNLISGLIETQEETLANIKAKRHADGLIGHGTKLDKKNFSGVMNALEKIFKETTSVQFNPGKLEKNRIKELDEKLGGVFAHTAIKAESEQLKAQEEQAQPSERTLSEAAFVAKDVKLADQQETPVFEPKKLRLNTEQLAAMNRLFGSCRQVVTKEEPAVVDRDVSPGLV